MDEIQKELRIKSLELVKKCGDGNPQSIFSCIDIVWVLYDKIMNWSPKTAEDYDRDLFVISKGQATVALFSVLYKKGYYTDEELDTIGQFDSKFCIQADVTKFDGGIENSAGSLGHGFPMAAGMALANKIKKSPSKVYALVGDGEFFEGTMWETCLFAAGKKLDNLCLIVDDNDSAGSMIDMGSLNDKLSSFGFDVFSVDGHNLKELEGVLSKSPEKGKPMAVIAKTVRGIGSKTMMENDIWFHKAPSDEELKQLVGEIKSICG